MICDNIKVNSSGVLEFAGQSTVELANKYSTPLYLLDEARIRKNCQTYYNAMKEAYGENFAVLYASKANSFKRMYEIVNEENMHIDVVSSGEIFTALKAGYPIEKAYFHRDY